MLKIPALPSRYRTAAARVPKIHSSSVYFQENPQDLYEAVKDLYGAGRTYMRQCIQNNWISFSQLWINLPRTWKQTRATTSDFLIHKMPYIRGDSSRSENIAKLMTAILEMKLVIEKRTSNCNKSRKTKMVLLNNIKCLYSEY